MTDAPRVDYTLNNPDTLTKYKTAAQISEKVLAEVTKLIVPGAKIVEICQKGDALIEEELAKVYRGKKVTKGFSHPTTVSPSSFVTPYTPLTTDESEAAVEIKADEPIKIQLGAQIDGFGSIVCDTVIAGAEGEVTGRNADLVLATYYANELLLRLMIPPGTLGSDDEKAKAASTKAPTQTKITSLLEKVVKSYDCSLVESTTSWLFDRNEIEGTKKITGVSLGSGKVKQYENRTTLHRRTLQTYGLKRPTSRKILSEVVKKFGVFPLHLRQLEDERDAKTGVVECVRSNVFRQYEVVGDKDNSPVGRLLTTIAITKNGITKLGAAPALDLSKYKTDKKIEDEEILKILEQPIARNTGKKKNNKKKKKPAKKAAAAAAEESSEEESDDE
ncbi:curved DNA-binding protein [Verticillium alfalfae VaMs.102]|uniref:Curved DNA-binding protein n=1 Tax=Verticillium alfalfae (strain VaMs.102 / ATCC MYA-4576 / FGSC 10136) TaxID=526221 RepID=C9SPF4_VERA1|nr:curved DNA-binding protein [Verticillium alfalfae VaMs.102]EEY20669.1 curved DNA-binding protein [Verticillium alfalfae VaMs.102]